LSGARSFVELVLFQILPEFELKLKFKLKFKLNIEFKFKFLQISFKSFPNSNSCLSLNSNFPCGPDHHVGPPPHAIFHVSPQAAHHLPSGPTTPTGRHMGEPPLPLRHMGPPPPHHRAQIIHQNKVWKFWFEPKSYNIRNIVLITKLHFHLWLYSIFSIIILIIYYYNV
jgi:hypothetical protein